MPSNYPAALDDLSNPSGTQRLSVGGGGHAALHTNINDAIEAIQAALGVNPQGGYDTLGGRINGRGRDVKDFGAKGDGATPDLAAFQAALISLRANEGFFGKQHALFLPRGDYPVSGSLLLGSTSNTVSTFRRLIAEGARIVSTATGKAVLDWIGTNNKSITGPLAVYGDQTDTPSVGLLLSRPSNGISSGFGDFYHLLVEGYYSVAALYKVASEVDRFARCYFQNSAGRCAAYIGAAVDAVDAVASDISALTAVTTFNTIHEFDDVHFGYYGTQDAGSAANILANHVCVMDLASVLGAEFAHCLWDTNREDIPAIRVRTNTGGPACERLTFRQGTVHGTPPVGWSIEGNVIDMVIDQVQITIQPGGWAVQAASGVTLSGFRFRSSAAGNGGDIDLSAATSAVNYNYIETNGRIQLPPIFYGDIYCTAANVPSFAGVDFRGRLFVQGSGLVLDRTPFTSITALTAGAIDVTNRTRINVVLTGAATLTSLTGGVTGQRVKFIFQNANCSVAFSGNFVGFGMNTWNPTTWDTAWAEYDGVRWLWMVEPSGTGPADFRGAGSPEGAVTARVGSTFRRSDGGAGTCFYVKESGTGNTGWVAK